MLLNREGKVFIGARIDNTDEAWQMPQGGMDDGEEPWATAERELEDMQAQLKTAERDRPVMEGDRSSERAWRDVQSAGGARPGMDLQDELLKSDMDRAAREAEATAPGRGPEAAR